MAFPFIVQGNNIVVVIGNQSHTINKTHISYDKIKEAIKAADWDTVKDLIEPKKVVLKYGAGNVAIQGDKLFWKGQELHNTLAFRMIQMYQEGFPIEPMVAFMENLMKNPSKRAVSELYKFLEKGNLPITPDGYFLAYKKVREDFLDVHSGSVLNKPAYMMTDEDKAGLAQGVFGKKKEVTVAIENDVTVVSMERNQVDDNANNTCSEGLHFCSKDYLGHFGGSKVVILKINPADVVSIPADYNDTKGRCCRYEVIGELGVNAEDAFVSTVQATAVGSA